MTARREASARTLGEGVAGNRLVPAPGPQTAPAAPPSEDLNPCSAEVHAHRSWMNQFLQNLLRALSAWPV
jgi:hypothetical protein